LEQITKADPNLGMGASATLEPWAVAALEALRAEAERLATEFAARTLRERTARPRSERGELGIRIRSQPAALSREGTFTCEWYRVLGRARTSYLAKGRGGRYPRSAFRDAQPWEQALVEELEPQLARIRAIARGIAELRRAAAHHDKRVRQLAEGAAEEGEGDSVADS
jgi:hypothetical protein